MVNFWNPMPTVIGFRSFIPGFHMESPYVSLNPLSAVASAAVVLLLYWML